MKPQPKKWALECQVHQTVSGHPNVVAVREVFFSESTSVAPAKCLIVMELCRESLWAYIDHWCFVNDADVLAWARDLCLALAHVHAHDILHRDVTPGNCLLAPLPASRCVLKLADFGNSACLMGPPAGTPLNTLQTTYRYASPEVVKKLPYSLPLDVWSLGVILWEILQEDARKPAVNWDKDDSLEDLEKAVTVFSNKVAEKRPLASGVEHDASPLRVACQMLEVDPGSRPVSAAVLEDPWFRCRHDSAVPDGAGANTPVDPKGSAAPEAVDVQMLAGGVEDDARTGPGARVEAAERDAENKAPIDLRGAAGSPAERDAEIKTLIDLRGAAGSTITGDARDVVIDCAATVLPQKWQVAVELSPILAELMPTGDVCAYMDACDALQCHQGNVLLHYLLAQAKYPMVVRHFASLLAGLPAGFGVAELLSKCQETCRFMAANNETEQFQREMYLYNDQRMGAVMGMHRVMAKLGVLQRMLHWSQGAGRNVICLGSAKPRAVYKICNNKTILKHVVENFATLAVKPEGKLTNAKLLAMVKWLSAEVFAHGFLPSASGEQTEQKVRPRVSHSSFQKVRFRVRSKRTQEECNNADSEIARQTQYVTLHYIRKHVMWLVRKHESLGSCQVDFEKMHLTDLAKLVPDEQEYLSELQEAVTMSAGKVASMLQVQPLMISCCMCLLGKLLEGRQESLLQLFRDQRHWAALKRNIAQHKTRYGFPPSPWALIFAFQQEGLKCLKRRAAVAAAVRKTKIAATVEEPSEGGASANPLVSGIGASRSVGAALVPMVGAGDSDGLDVDPTLLVEGGCSAPAAAHRPQGADAVGVADAHRAQAGVAHVCTWYPIGEQGSGVACGCTGNCNTECPARSSGGCCPNPASVNLPGVRCRAYHRPLCKACVCRELGCQNSARRPYGQHIDLEKSYGHCKRHWVVIAHERRGCRKRPAS